MIERDRWNEVMHGKDTKQSMILKQASDERSLLMQLASYRCMLTRKIKYQLYVWIDFI